MSVFNDINQIPFALFKTLLTATKLILFGYRFDIFNVKNGMKTKYLLWFSLLLVWITSCKKDIQVSLDLPVYPLRLYVYPKIQNLNLFKDSIMYQNKAGSMYSVTRYNSYLSGFRFYKNGNLLQESDAVFYYDAFDTSTWNLHFTDLHVTSFDEMHFVTGVIDSKNRSNSLPATVANINMAWPDEIGGGYHFLKMEGRYLDPNAKNLGFVMHLGKSGFQSPAVLYPACSLRSDSLTTLRIKVDVGDWLAAKQAYDFNVQGSYTMNIDSLMLILKNNGTQVYTLSN